MCVSQINPVHSPRPYSFRIHFNIFPPPDCPRPIRLSQIAYTCAPHVQHMKTTNYKAPQYAVLSIPCSFCLGSHVPHNSESSTPVISMSFLRVSQLVVLKLIRGIYKSYVSHWHQRLYQISLYSALFVSLSFVCMETNWKSQLLITEPINGSNNWH